VRVRVRVRVRVGVTPLDLEIDQPHDVVAHVRLVRVVDEFYVADV